jgi:hypothetical protein
MKLFFKNFSNLLISITLISFSFQALNFPFKIISKPPSQTPNTFLSFAESPTLSFPVIPNTEDFMCLELCLSSPKFCRLFAIHGQSFYIWVQDEKNKDKSIELSKKYNPNKSTTSQVKRILKEYNYEEDQYITAYSIIDHIYIKDQFLMKGYFLSAIDSTSFKGDEGMIGLGYRGSKKEEQYSFINQLYNNGLIFHRVFTQNFEKGDQGIISFGEIPKNIVNDYKNYGRCNALDKIKNGERYKNRKWECAITKALINDNDNISIEGENLVSFFSYRNRALVPSTFFNTLVQTYFKDLLNQKICETIKDRRYDVVSCKEIPSNSPTLTLVFGDWGMKLTKENLYIKNEQNNKYEFIFYHKQNF